MYPRRGPYVSPEDGPRGAHNLAHVRLPNIREFQRWQDVSQDLVGIVTLAPELRGATDYIRALSTQGTLVSIGHTAADPL